MAQDQKSTQDQAIEEIKVQSGKLVARVREIVEEGNARRIIVKKGEDTVMEFPLSVGVGGATAAIMLHPMLAAIGAFASLATDIRLLVERPPESEQISEASSDTTE
jgi:hypothetical protein